MSLKQSIKDNIHIFIAFGLMGVSIVVIGYFGWGYVNQIFTVQQNNNADHWQSAIKSLDTFTGKNPEDCLDLTSHLQDHYKLDDQNNIDWYNYLAHEYYKARDLGCSPLPNPIKTIQDSYHE